MVDDQPTAEPVGVFVGEEKRAGAGGGARGWSERGYGGGAETYHSLRNARAAVSCASGAGQLVAACGRGGGPQEFSREELDIGVVRSGVGVNALKWTRWVQRIMRRRDSRGEEEKCIRG